MDNFAAASSGVVVSRPWAAPHPDGLLRHFTRITTSTSYLPEIDGLRFLAILGVMLFHLPVALRYAPLPGFAKAWVTAGQLGVQLFFIISGFVLALPFARRAILGGRPVNLQNYFLRRLTRLEPPYLISLLLFYELRNFFARGGLHPGHLLAGIVYLHWLHYGYPNPINPVAWSLEVEVQFYLLVPLLTMVFILPARARRSVLALCILLSLAVNCISDFTPMGYTRVFQWSLAGYLHFFLIGFLFADLYLCSKLTRPSLAWDVLTLGALVFVVYGHIYRYTDETTSAIGLAIIFGAAFLGKWSRRILRYPWIATIGGMCYSIYLIHHFVLQAIGEYFAHHAVHGGALEYAIAALLLLPLVIVISGIFFVLVERPCMDPEWPQKLVRAVRGMRLAHERIN